LPATASARPTVATVTSRTLEVTVGPVRDYPNPPGKDLFRSVSPWAWHRLVAAHAVCCNAVFMVDQAGVSVTTSTGCPPRSSSWSGGPLIRLL
jgi:hypothetical protein